MQYSRIKGILKPKEKTAIINLEKCKNDLFVMFTKAFESKEI